MSLAAATGFGVAVGPFWVDVDQTHLHGAERTAQLPVAAVALVAEPGVFRSPEDVFRLHDVGAAEGEPERFEAHRLEGDVAGEDQQVGPGDLTAVLLLDRPQQPSRPVQVRVVRPAVEGREALGALPATTPTVGGPVGARGVPRHPDEQRAVVPVVGRPPLLGVGHDVHDIALELVHVEARERLGVVELLSQGTGAGLVLAKDPKIRLVGPPVLVRPRPVRARLGGIDGWVLALAAVFRHVGPPFVLGVPGWMLSRSGVVRRAANSAVSSLGRPGWCRRNRAPADIADRQARREPARPTLR